MKKLVTLLAAAGMVVAASAPASAVDVKVDYRHRISFDTFSQDFAGKNYETAKQRVRLGLTMAASENLKGYIQFQTAKDSFGSANSTAGHTTKTIQVRQSYIDWTVPATPVKVRMGRQLVGFPTEALGHNSVMDAGWGGRDGVVVSAPVTDWLGLSALWVRAGVAGEDVDTNKSDDIFGLIANTKFDAFTASVYAAYANLDCTGSTTIEGIGIRGTDINGNDYDLANDAGIEGTGYWVGATFKLTAFDPFTLALSAAYGAAEADGNNQDIEQKGWNVQAKASYKLGFGTPVLGAWYASGADADDLAKGELGIMPSVGGYIAPTLSYHDNAASLEGGHGYYLPSGNWGVQVGIEGMSFLQDLSHNFLITYMEGTNDKDCGLAIKGGGLVGQYLTEDDSLVSFDFVSTYKIYKNLAAHLELAYIINDIDNDAYKADFDEDDWRVGLTFDFKF